MDGSTVQGVGTVFFADSFRFKDNASLSVVRSGTGWNLETSAYTNGAFASVFDQELVLKGRYEGTSNFGPDLLKEIPVEIINGGTLTVSTRVRTGNAGITNAGISLRLKKSSSYLWAAYLNNGKIGLNGKATDLTYTMCDGYYNDEGDKNWVDMMVVFHFQGPANTTYEVYINGEPVGETYKINDWTANSAFTGSLYVAVAGNFGQQGMAEDGVWHNWAAFDDFVMAEGTPEIAVQNPEIYREGVKDAIITGSQTLGRTIMNATDTAFSGMIFTAYYDADGRLNKVEKPQSVLVPAYSSRSFEIAADVGESDIQVRSFLWDGEGAIKPLAGKCILEK